MDGNIMKIVCDSSGDLFDFEGAKYQTVPLKIITKDMEYVDDAGLDVEGMVNTLLSYKGKSGTACPGVGEWLEAFEDEELVYCVTISSNLSGSYNAACSAAQDYMNEHPGREVYIVDSLSAGPGLRLLVEKLAELGQQGLSGKEIFEQITEYRKKTQVTFCLESLRNLANNGRVSQAAAMLSGIIGIRVVGKATGGRLDVVDKVRGEKKALMNLFHLIKEEGYKGGKLIIGHCFNEEAAKRLLELVRQEFAKAEVLISKTAGLCSFYAEKGGLIIGFEC
ncbi:MAG: DegV family protein [Lachnospiraceae bacterium]|nr:DegV family protein [Lachnospiraceae bacterium]